MGRDILQNCVEGNGVTVDIREHCQLHGDQQELTAECLRITNARRAVSAHHARTGTQYRVRRRHRLWREPKVHRNGRTSFLRITFRGTSDSRSSVDRDTRVRIDRHCAGAVLWPELGERLTDAEKQGAA